MTAILEAPLTVYRAHLAACLTGSGNPLAGVLPLVKAVILGDRSPTDDEQPAVTVDWVTESMTESGAIGFGPLESSFEVAFNLYVSSLKKGDEAHALVRTIYGDETAGLRKAVLSLPPGSGYAVFPLTTRKLRKEERSSFRFSEGLTMRVLMRKFANF